MKTLKVEGVYPMAFESEEDVAGHLPRFIDSYNERRLHSALGYLSPNRFEEEQPRKPVKSSRLKLSGPRGPLQQGVNVPRLTTPRSASD